MRGGRLLIGVVIAIFNLLGDTQTVNAFALPGGPIFITRRC